MTSTNDGKDVKSNQTGGQKGKTYYIELYKSLDAQLNSECELSERVALLCNAWRRVHTLCQHSTPTTHPFLLAWIQRHTARTVLQSEWQSPKGKNEHAKLEEAIDSFVQECRDSPNGRDAGALPWESQLRSRAEWFKGMLASPWGHPVLKVLLDPTAQRPTTDELIKWLLEERGVVFSARLRQLAMAKCDDLALTLLTAVMDRVRQCRPSVNDLALDEETPEPQADQQTFENILNQEAGFSEVWDLLTDMELVLLHKGERNTRLIDLAKQTPLANGYQLVERLINRREAWPKEKKIWKNAKDVAMLIAQVMITRCMVVPQCTGEVRKVLYWCSRALVRVLPPNKLGKTTLVLAAPACTARHLHALASAVHQQSADSEELKPFVVELYVRAITFGMNELEKLKLKPEYKAQEARCTEQTLSSWFIQLGQLLVGSERMRCECILTAFSVHPAAQHYDRIKRAPLPAPASVHAVASASALVPAANDTSPIKDEPETTDNSWAKDSRSQTNFVKTSETLNIKQTQHSANVLSTAILNEGEALGLDAELCQDIIVLLSGPRVKTLSWDMDRETLLENCRVHMERTGSGTRALTTELKYLNLDPRQYQHLPEEDDNEDDIYYGIEKGYEHLVEFEPQPEQIWEDALGPEHTETADSSCNEGEIPRRKKKSKLLNCSSESDYDPLSLVAEHKREKVEKKERPHSKERSSSKEPTKNDDAKKDSKSHERKKDKKERKKEKKERKKKEKKEKQKPMHSMSHLVGVKVTQVPPEEARGLCITDSDYDSQGKSSLQSEGNDEHVVYDGQFSMDELKSPVKRSPEYNMNLSKELNAASSHIAKALNCQISDQNIHGDAQIKELASVYTETSKPVSQTDTKEKTIKADLKKSITKLIQFRKQKSAESVTDANTRPTSSLSSLIGTKLQNTIDMSFNKTQTEQLAAMKKEAKGFRNAIYYPPKQPGTCSRTQPFHPARARQRPPTSQPAFDMSNLPQDPTILNNAMTQYSQMQAKKPQTTEQCAQSSHLRSYQQFIKELERSSFGGLPITEEKKREIKPISRVDPIILKLKTEPVASVPASPAPCTAKHEPAAPAPPSPQCAKPIPPKKVETTPSNAPNTFARLSYLHKNKLNEKPKLEPSPTLHCSISEELDMRIAELRMSKAAMLMDKHETTLNSGNVPPKRELPKVEVQAIEQDMLTLNLHKEHPVLANILRNSIETTVKVCNNTEPHKAQSEGRTFATKPKQSSLSEKDQQDILKLLGQKSRMQIQPTETKLINTNILNNTVSQMGKVDVSNKCVSGPSKPRLEKHQQNQAQNNEVIEVKARLPVNIGGTNFQFPVISNTTILKTTAMIQDNKVLPVKQVQLKQCKSKAKGKASQKPKNDPKIQIQVDPTNVFKINKEISKKYVPKPPQPTPQYNDNNKEQDWAKVLDALLSQKTPNRGPNALDMAMNKDALKNANANDQIVKSPITKKVENFISSILEQQVAQQNDVTSPNVLRQASSKSIGVSPKVENYIAGMLEQQSVQNNKTSPVILHQAPTKSTGAAPKVIRKQPKKPEIPKKPAQVETKKQNLPNPLKLCSDVTKQQNHPQLHKDDPFISGIQNSDYDILEELLDDDLRKEIGELSSDEDNYGATVMPAKGPKHEIHKNATTVLIKNNAQGKAKHTVDPRLVLNNANKTNQAVQEMPTAMPHNAPQKEKLRILSNEKVDIRNFASNIIPLIRKSASSPGNKPQDMTIYNVNYNSQSMPQAASTTVVKSSNLVYSSAPQPSRQNVVIHDPFGVATSNQNFVPVDNTSKLVYQPYTQNIGINVASQVIINSSTFIVPAINTQPTAVNITFNTPTVAATTPTVQISHAPSHKPVPIISCEKMVLTNNHSQTKLNPTNQQPNQNVVSKENTLKDIKIENKAKSCKTQVKGPTVVVTPKMTKKSHGEAKGKQKAVLKPRVTLTEKVLAHSTSQKVTKDPEIEADKSKEKFNTVQASSEKEFALANKDEDEKRIAMKRQAILNRQINYYLDVPSIALSYTPLVTEQTNTVKYEKVPEQSKFAKIISKTESTENKEENEDGAGCRRILLRSSNKISDVAKQSDKLGWKTKVRLKDVDHNKKASEVPVLETKSISEIASNKLKNSVENYQTGITTVDPKITESSDEVRNEMTNVNSVGLSQTPAPIRVSKRILNKKIKKSKEDKTEFQNVVVQEKEKKMKNKVLEASDKTVVTSLDAIVVPDRDGFFDIEKAITGAKILKTQDFMHVDYTITATEKALKHESVLYSEKTALKMNKQPFSELTIERKEILPLMEMTNANIDEKTLKDESVLDSEISALKMNKMSFAEPNIEKKEILPLVEMTNANIDEKTLKDEFVLDSEISALKMNKMSFAEPNIEKKEILPLTKMTNPNIDEKTITDESVSGSEKTALKKNKKPLVELNIKMKEILPLVEMTNPSIDEKTPKDESVLDSEISALKMNKKSFAEPNIEKTEIISLMKMTNPNINEQTIKNESVSDSEKIALKQNKNPLVELNIEMKKILPLMELKNPNIDTIEILSSPEIDFSNVNPLTKVTYKPYEKNENIVPSQPKSGIGSTLDENLASKPLNVKKAEGVSVSNKTNDEEDVHLPNNELDTALDESELRKHPDVVETATLIEHESSDTATPNVKISSGLKDETESFSVPIASPATGIIMTHDEVLSVISPICQKLSTNIKLTRLVDDIESALSVITETAVSSPMIDTPTDIEIADKQQIMQETAANPIIKSSGLLENTSKIISASTRPRKLERDSIAEMVPPLSNSKDNKQKTMNEGEISQVSLTSHESSVDAINCTSPTTISVQQTKIVNHKDTISLSEDSDIETMSVIDAKGVLEDSFAAKMITPYLCKETCENLNKSNKHHDTTTDETVVENKLEMEVIVPHQQVEKSVEKKAIDTVSLSDDSEIESTSKIINNITATPEKVDSDTLNKNSFNQNDIPQSYKDSIQIVEVPIPGNTNPFKRRVKISLPNNRHFKATVYGKMTVSFDSLFEEPALKNVLLSNLQDKKKYTVNIQQTSREKPTTVETVNLISDDEDEPALPLQHFKTSTGSYKIRHIKEDIFKKHREKLAQKCTVNLPRCDDKTKTKSLVKALIKDLAPSLNPEIVPSEVIEIDDSASEDELQGLPKIYALKDMLLKDLGVEDDSQTENLQINENLENILPNVKVVKNKRLSRTRRSIYHRERDPITVIIPEKRSSSQTKREKSANAAIDEISDEDEHQPDYSHIIKRKYYIELVRCDEMIKALPQQAEGDEQDYLLEDHVTASNDVDGTDAPLSRSGSFSLLNDLKALDVPIATEITGASIFDAYDSLNVLYSDNSNRTSPVMKVYDMIVAFKDKPMVNTVREIDVHKCNCDWFHTKRNLYFEQLEAEKNKEHIFDKTDVLTDCETDATDFDATFSDSEVAISDSVPSLQSIVAKYFESNPIVNVLKPIGSKVDSDVPKTPIKRKTTDQNNHISKVIKTSHQSNINMQILHDENSCLTPKFKETVTTKEECSTYINKDFSVKPVTEICEATCKSETGSSDIKNAESMIQEEAVKNIPQKSPSTADTQNIETESSSTKNRINEDNDNVTAKLTTETLDDAPHSPVKNIPQKSPSTADTQNIVTESSSTKDRINEDNDNVTAKFTTQTLDDAPHSPLLVNNTSELTPKHEDSDPDELSSSRKSIENLDQSVDSENLNVILNPLSTEKSVKLQDDILLESAINESDVLIQGMSSSINQISTTHEIGTSSTLEARRTIFTRLSIEKPSNSSNGMNVLDDAVTIIETTADSRESEKSVSELVDLNEIPFVLEAINHQSTNNTAVSAILECECDTTNSYMALPEGAEDTPNYENFNKSPALNEQLNMSANENDVLQLLDLRANSSPTIESNVEISKEFDAPQTPNNVIKLENSLTQIIDVKKSPNILDPTNDQPLSLMELPELKLSPMIIDDTLHSTSKSPSPEVSEDKYSCDLDCSNNRVTNENKISPVDPTILKNTQYSVIITQTEDSTTTLETSSDLSQSLNMSFKQLNETGNMVTELEQRSAGYNENVSLYANLDTVISAEVEEGSTLHIHDTIIVDGKNIDCNIFSDNDTNIANNVQHKLKISVDEKTRKCKIDDSTHTDVVLNTNANENTIRDTSENTSMVEQVVVKCQQEKTTLAKSATEEHNLSISNIIEKTDREVIESDNSHEINIKSEETESVNINYNQLDAITSKETNQKQSDSTAKVEQPPEEHHYTSTSLEMLQNSHESNIKSEETEPVNINCNKLDITTIKETNQKHLDSTAKDEHEDNNTPTCIEMLHRLNSVVPSNAAEGSVKHKDLSNEIQNTFYKIETTIEDCIQIPSSPLKVDSEENVENIAKYLEDISVPDTCANLENCSEEETKKVIKQPTSELKEILEGKVESDVVLPSIPNSGNSAYKGTEANHYNHENNAPEVLDPVNDNLILTNMQYNNNKEKVQGKLGQSSLSPISEKLVFDSNEEVGPEEKECVFETEIVTEIILNDSPEVKLDVGVPSPESTKSNECDNILVEKSIREIECDENILKKNATLVYKDDSGVILKGIEYEDPEIGTCYVFPLVKSSDNIETSDLINESVGSSIEVIHKHNSEFEVQSPKRTEGEIDVHGGEDLQVIQPKTTYFKRNLKRKSNMKDVIFIKKRPRRNSRTSKIYQFTFRKGKKIDAPKLTTAAITDLSYSKEFQHLKDYCDNVGFSYSITYSTEFIDVSELLQDWPINGPIVEDFNYELEVEDAVYADTKDMEKTTEDPLQLTLVEELTANYNDTNYSNNRDVEETIFNMGFGEGSGRVIQNLDGGAISKFSAATLSDVKQSQPFLLSEKSDDTNKVKYHQSSQQEQLETIKRFCNYLKLKEKVRSFFINTTIELTHLPNKEKDSLNNEDASSFPFNLYIPKVIAPRPIETIVQVVQVGQLAVSAAAQNPVTCDPRVTQVSNASPSQCSVDNSPHDPQQDTRTEYTELTTADLSMPLVEDYVQHNQSLPTDSQEGINMTLSTENIPIQTELLKSGMKFELADENPDEKEKSLENCDQTDTNNHVNNVEEFTYETNNTSAAVEAEIQALFESKKQDVSETIPDPKPQNGSVEKTDQIAHAMNAAGITTTTETVTNRAQAFVNLLSQKIRQTAVVSSPNTPNNYTKTTTINSMSLQQALAQILPPPLNHTNSAENNHQIQNTVTPQVLHIVQGKGGSGNQITLVDNTQQSVINTPNATPVLHIVQSKSAPGTTSNGSPAPQSNTFSGISLVDAGLQQGGNQLLHIVNTGNQKNNNASQLLKRVNLLTNLANVQGSNEQKMVQFVCKSADGKSIQLNAPHQRSMVLRLQPIEPPNVQPATPKPVENQELSPTPNVTINTAPNKTDSSNTHEIKSRSVYEENYAKFIQSSSNKSTVLEKLPKFNQAFGKSVYQDGTQKQNEISTNNLPPLNTGSENSECPPTDNSINLDQIGPISSPPLLLRKSPQTTQPQPNLVQQIKQAIAPMNLQTMHGGVIYTRQIPVNIGGGQTINLITVPSTEIVDESGQKQQINQENIESSIIKIVPQNQPQTTNTEGTSLNEDHAQQNPPQPQPVLTQMRIKLPMLSKNPQMVSGARVVRPSFFQIQRNIVGGANQQVYQQLVLTAAPPLGQQTIRLPQTQTRQIKIPENQSPESQMSSSTLEQLREFDMVLEQVKERSTGQPNSNSNSSFQINNPSTDTTDSATSTTSTSVTETTQVLYSIGSNQPLNVTYVNRKSNVNTPTTSTFVRSPDSSGIADSPTSSSSQPQPQADTAESSSSGTATQQKVKISSRQRPRPKLHQQNTVKVTPPPKPSAQKPLEDEQTTQRILYILAEYKEQVENSPDKDKPAPRRRNNPPTNPSGSSKRKKCSSGSRRSGRDLSPIHDDMSRTMGSEDSSCGTSQGDCNESCMDSHSPQDSPRKVTRKLTFEPEPSPTSPPTSQPQRNVIVADGQTITVARGTTGKPATAVLMPANYILPMSMVKGGQQIAIVTNRGPKLLTVGGGEGGATNALFLQRLIGPAGLKPVLARPGVRHVRLPTAALHNLQAFNLATASTAQPPDSTASPASDQNPPDLVESNRNETSPWADRSGNKPDRASSPDETEPWNLPSSADPNDYSYEETVRSENMNRTVLDQIQDRYSPDMEAQRIFDKMFDVEAKKSYIVDSVDSPRCGYDIDASDCDDKPYQVVHKKDTTARQGRFAHVSAAALRHKYAILEHELRLQKSLSEECEDLGVDSPSASELFPEAELLFAASPAQDHASDIPQHSHTPQPTLLNQTPIQPDIDDQIATDHLLQRDNNERQDLDVNLGLEDVGIVTVSEDGMQATIALDQEEFARSHPNTTFHSEPTDEGVVQPFTISGLKTRHITSTIFHSNRAPATVLMTAPQTTVISQATAHHTQHNVKYSDIDNMINSLPSTHTNLSSVLVKDDGLTRFDNILTDSRELHLSNTASAIVHSGGNATQVIRRVCYDDSKRVRDSFLMDEPEAIIAGDDAKMVAEDSSRDATLESMGGDVDDDISSPGRHVELFWESNSASERSESRRPLDFSSDSDKCCKSPSYDETNSTDSSGIGAHVRLDSVIKDARGLDRSGSADGSSADDTHPPLRTYPPKRLFHTVEGDLERSLSGKTRAGERSPDLEVRRRASGRGVVKRGCHCCNGSPAPPRSKKPRLRKPTTDFTN